MAKRLLLADDHALVLEGLTRLLSGHFEIVGTAVDGRTMRNAFGPMRLCLTSACPT